MKTALFWEITQRVVLYPYRCFGTTFLSYLFSWILDSWRWDR